mmetsp:Transcript_12007/g.28480  ORF Transcript_12007/g.28480 Transcript_12007/m.28480 type:complete len:661 (+) Transcript_12007:288-2270(+)|eukprot:CAMPEP_0197177764 /NCGR_PEP_ID=MMETSP1423-20130617/3258_1 /TAXON_ID=476441 /ORGANISM="Pseudo-nitzschia heimii, Strain UNC1101" /LENGTH=660 /DNA_ID=CAMNT_0042627369 /DNA_START=180 /DNA_END=2162 /DNA_ORIENTATION=-
MDATGKDDGCHGKAEEVERIIGSSAGLVDSAIDIDGPEVEIGSSSSFSCFDGKSGDLNLGGAFFRILEYLRPCDFYVLGALVGSHFWKQLLFEDPETEYLYAPPGTEEITAGRTHLKNLHFFRLSVEGRRTEMEDRKRKRKRLNPRIQLNRVGVFSSQEEEMILQHDKNGYFGLSSFRPGVLAVWGDYSGIFLTSHVDRIFSSEQTPSWLVRPAEPPPGRGTAKIEPSKEEGEEAKDASSSKNMGKEGCGYLFTESYQVMAVHFSKPYVFLGFATGTIHSIDSRPVYRDSDPSSSSSKDPTATESGKTIEYPHVSECTDHCQRRGEISSLAAVEGLHLVSAAMSLIPRKATILIHWNALKDGNLRRISRMRIDASIYGRPISEIPDVSPLSMASFTVPFFVHECGVWSYTILTIGARNQNLAHVCLWKTVEDSEHKKSNYDPDNGDTIDFERPPCNFHPFSGFVGFVGSRQLLRKFLTKRVRGRLSNHFVFLKVFQDVKLIVGTSKGELLKFDRWVGSYEKEEVSEGDSILCNCCRAGMIEAVELVGNKNPIMITAGGYDGKIHFWGWEDFGVRLGSLKIHPGHKILVEEAALASSAVAVATAAAEVLTKFGSRSHKFSPVISTYFCHERSSLVSFCRDGHLHEWKVEEQKRSSSGSAER